MDVWISSDSLAGVVYILTYVETYASSAFAPAAGQFTRGSKPKAPAGCWNFRPFTQQRRAASQMRPDTALVSLLRGHRWTTLGAAFATEIRQTISLRPGQREHTVFVDHHLLRSNWPSSACHSKKNTAFSTTAPPTLQFALEHVRTHVASRKTLTSWRSSCSARAAVLAKMLPTVHMGAFLDLLDARAQCN